jgi:hypothetical protein
MHIVMMKNDKPVDWNKILQSLPQVESSGEYGQLNWVTVNSSAVEKVAFKDDVLYVEYKKGGNIYSYTTSKEVFDELLSSESIGRFMIAARKDNRIEDIGEIPF